MSREAPWFKFYAARWLGNRGVRYMTPEQRGYFIQLMCEAWESDPAGTLPELPEMLWKLAGAPNRRRFEKEGAVVLAQFELHDGRYFYPELIEQHQGLAAMHESRTRAAMKGATARWSKRREIPNALPNAEQSHASGNAYQNREEKEQRISDALPGTRRWDIEQQRIAYEADMGKLKRRA